jgi:YD repeat-containing protein
VWGLDLSQAVDGAGGIGGLLSVVDEAGGQIAFVYDGHGNVGQLVDEAGSVVAKYEYDAFGNVLVASGLLRTTTAIGSRRRWRMRRRGSSISENEAIYLDSGAG